MITNSKFGSYNMHSNYGQGYVKSIVMLLSFGIMFCIYYFLCFTFYRLFLKLCLEYVNLDIRLNNLC